MLAASGWIDTSLADALKKMVGFRNIAVHDYQRMLVPIAINVITHHLDEFLQFSAAVLKRVDGQPRAAQLPQLPPLPTTPE